MSHEKSYSKMTWAVTKIVKNKILVKRTVINSVSILSPSLIIKVREIALLFQGKQRVATHA